MSKAERLKNLETEILKNRSLPFPESNLVFGEGDPDAAVVFVGEAPGATENELRRPFVGRAGQLLERLIKDLGWQRTTVYITNIVKRRPPNNRDPLPEEIEAYKPYLARQIEIIKPKIIATLGRFAMNYFLPTAKITRDQGKLFPASPAGGPVNGEFIYPLFHPAAALRSTTTLQALETSFKRLPAALKEVETHPASPPSSPPPKADQTSLF